ncbi:S-adenosyl-L-methionine-dependent methyltransferase [Westerdykella ornata]|uniref:S-adenosyl-L-methionine-dependent methyltransferase n=1 Tax=Westerdykella ornata TaxID=318751 RepID=A0A6A6JJP3_WESOR|nr:S-adenosyl-L-methionine-dependent methyltransferase [Westerdykella ornata]KAF2276353.1 S-adenosyl-L-methionine-dependent methyltransferase [Westerdykella ornata]
MTQPTSINVTFDTSLTEVPTANQQSQTVPAPNISFFTTESDPSDAGLRPSTSQLHRMEQESTNPNSTPASGTRSMTPTTVQHLPTQEAYDQWANVYDTDGNMLQAIDDLELSTLLPEFLSTLTSTRPVDSSTITLIDLGCGTGRNTTKLLAYNWPEVRSVRVTGLDFSKGMLDIAAKKVQGAVESGKREINLQQCDCFPTVRDKNASPVPPVEGLAAADAAISTLVLEHVPLQDYFATLAALVVNGGYALVTNMHSEMGSISQAGFVNAQGVKVRGESFAHTPQETAEEAKRAGFEVLRIMERRMEERDVESGLVGYRGRKWIGVMVWYGLVLRKVE